MVDHWPCRVVVVISTVGWLWTSQGQVTGTPCPLVSVQVLDTQDRLIWDVALLKALAEVHKTPPRHFHRLYNAVLIRHSGLLLCHSQYGEESVCRPEGRLKPLTGVGSDGQEKSGFFLRWFLQVYRDYGVHLSEILVAARRVASTRSSTGLISVQSFGW